MKIFNFKLIDIKQDYSFYMAYFRLISLGLLIMFFMPCMVMAAQRLDISNVGNSEEKFQLDEHVWVIPNEFSPGYVDDKQGIYLKFGWRNGVFVPIAVMNYGVLLNVHIKKIDFDYTNWKGPDYSILGLVNKSLFSREKIKNLTYIGSSSGVHYFALDTADGAFVSCFGVRGVVIGDEKKDLKSITFRCDLSFHLLRHTNVLVMADSITLDVAGQVLSDSVVALKSFVH